MPYSDMEYCFEKSPVNLTARDTRERLCSGPLSLSKEDRPRERLIRSGPQSLSDQDLLSVVLVSGIQGKNVTLLARELLSKLDTEKEIPSVAELCRLSGLSNHILFGGCFRMVRVMNHLCK